MLSCPYVYLKISINSFLKHVTHQNILFNNIYANEQKHSNFLLKKTCHLLNMTYT